MQSLTSVMSASHRLRVKSSLTTTRSILKFSVFGAIVYAGTTQERTLSCFKALVPELCITLNLGCVHVLVQIRRRISLLQNLDRGGRPLCRSRSQLSKHRGRSVIRI